MLPITYLNAAKEEKTANIPLTWRDITWAKFVEIESTKFKNEVERLAFIAGVETEYLLNNPLFLKAIIDATSFIYESDVNEYQQIILPEYRKLITENKCDDIGSKEWGKVETCKTAIKQSEDEPYKAAATIVKAYLNIDINDKPVVDVIGLVAFFLTKLGRFSENTNS